MVRVSKPTLHCHGCSIFRCSKENNYEHTIKMLVQISFQGTNEIHCININWYFAVQKGLIIFA
jgi:hypothetical protein